MPPKLKTPTKATTASCPAKVARVEQEQVDKPNIDSLPQLPMDIICSLLAAEKAYDALSNLRMVNFSYITLAFAIDCSTVRVQRQSI